MHESDGILKYKTLKYLRKFRLEETFGMVFFDTEMKQKNASFDAGWQKRRSGRAYNSLSGK